MSDGHLAAAGMIGGVIVGSSLQALEGVTGLKL